MNKNIEHVKNVYKQISGSRSLLMLKKVNDNSDQSTEKSTSGIKSLRTQIVGDMSRSGHPQTPSTNETINNLKKMMH